MFYQKPNASIEIKKTLSLETLPQITYLSDNTMHPAFIVGMLGVATTHLILKTFLVEAYLRFLEILFLIITLSSLLLGAAYLKIQSRYG